jgi:hypothetical protein
MSGQSVADQPRMVWRSWEVTPMAAQFMHKKVTLAGRCEGIFQPIMYSCISTRRCVARVGKSPSHLLDHVSVKMYGLSATWQGLLIRAYTECAEKESLYYFDASCLRVLLSWVGNHWSRVPRDQRRSAFSYWTSMKGSIAGLRQVLVRCEYLKLECW